MENKEDREKHMAYDSGRRTFRTIELAGRSFARSWPPRKCEMQDDISLERGSPGTPANHPRRFRQIGHK
jgi:hypothetical protein